MNMNRTRHNAPTNLIAGFSLIEMMVAMALGTIVVLAVASLFLANQRTFNLQGSLSAVQRQGSFARNFIVKSVRQAGFTESDQFEKSVWFDATPSGFSGSSNGATANDNDRLTFQFYGTIDCEGSETSDTDGDGSLDPTRVYETYWVQQNAAGVKQLICKGSVDNATNGVVILSGVPSFQVLYGVDTTQNDKQAIVSRYVTATVAKANPSWQVLAIRIGYIAQNVANGQGGIVANRSYQVLDQNLTGGSGVLSATNVVRREFVVTVPVRNYDWQKI